MPSTSTSFPSTSGWVPSSSLTNLKYPHNVMIKELFLLAIVFTLTYDPKTGTLENIAKPVSGTEGYRQQQQPRCNSITPFRYPKFRRTPVLRPRFNRRSQHICGYVDKHDHLAHIQFGMAEPLSDFSPGRVSAPRSFCKEKTT